MSTEVGTHSLEMAQNRGPMTVKYHVGPPSENELSSAGNVSGIQPHQTLNMAQARQFKYYSKEQGGTLNSVFSGGQRIDVDVVPSGIQKKDLWILRMTLQTTSGTVRIPCIPFLLNYVEIRPNQGQDTLGKPYGENFFFNLLSIDPDELEQLSSQLGLDSEWISGMDITTTPKVVSFPILGQWLSQGSNNFSGEFKDEVRFEWQFRSDAIVSGTAANLQMTDLRITALYHALDKSIKDQSMSLAKRGLKIRYHDYAIHKENVTLTAGADKTIELSGMTGKFAWLWVMIRATGSTGSSPFRDADKYYYPWDRIGLEESGGQKMLGGSDIEWEDFKTWWFPRFFPSASKFIKRYNIGMIPFCEDPNTDLQTASSTGFHIMSGNERLLIRPPSASLVNASLTFETRNSGTSAAAAPSGGNFKIRWVDPISGKFAKTPALAHNSTPAAIQAAVYALPNWMGVLTVTAENTDFSDGDMTFVFSGHYAGVPITESNFSIESTMENNTIGINAEVSASTAAVRGFTTGQYEIIVYGHYYNHLEFVGGQFGKYQYRRHKE